MIELVVWWLVLIAPVQGGGAVTRYIQDYPTEQACHEALTSIKPIENAKADCQGMKVYRPGPVERLDERKI